MNPDEILAFYEEFRGKPGWNSLETMRAFLPPHFAARTFDGFHFFTSHEILCICYFADHADRRFAPQFSIVAHAIGLLRFELTIHQPEPPIFRSFTERVICPLDRGLEQFDALFAKFRIAQKPE